MASKSKGLSRRKFLSQSSKAVAGLAATGVLASCNGAQITPAPKSRIRGTNDRINVAVIGIRGRGVDHAEAYAKSKHCRLKTLYGTRPLL